MLSEREVSTSIGSTAYGVNGDKLGTVEHFYVDDRTGAPTWVAVIPAGGAAGVTSGSGR